MRWLRVIPSVRIAAQLGRGAVHHRSGDQAQRWPRRLPSRVRPTSLPGIGDVAPRSVNWPRTERWRASWQISSNCSGHRSSRWLEAHLSRRYEPSGVTRDHLSQPVHPGPRRPEAGTGGAFAAHPSDAPFVPSHPEDEPPGGIHRYRRSASGRPALQTGRYLATGKATCCSAARTAIADPGRTSVTLRHAHQSRRQRYADRCQRPHQACAEATARALPIADLGSRQRDGRASSEKMIQIIPEILPAGGCAPAGTIVADSLCGEERGLGRAQAARDSGPAASGAQRVGSGKPGGRVAQKRGARGG